MTENVHSGIKVENGYVANNFKRKDIFGKYSELHLMYASIAEFGRSFSITSVHFLFHNLISVDSTSRSKNSEYILKSFDLISYLLHIFGNNFCNEDIIFAASIYGLTCGV